MSDDVAVWLGWLVAALGPVAVLALLSPLQASPWLPAVAVLAILIVIANGAALAGPGAAAAATVVAVLGLSFTSSSTGRSVLSLRGPGWPVVAVCGVGAALIHASPRRNENMTASAAARLNSSPTGVRIERIAGLIAAVTEPRLVVTAVEQELAGLLAARVEFRFSAPPAGMPRLERNGAIVQGAALLARPPMRLALPIGRPSVAHFVITTAPAAVIPLEHRIGAVILADHAGVALTSDPAPWQT